MGLVGDCFITRAKGEAGRKGKDEMGGFFGGIVMIDCGILVLEADWGRMMGNSYWMRPI